LIEYFLQRRNNFIIVLIMIQVRFGMGKVSHNGLNNHRILFYVVYQRPNRINCNPDFILRLQGEII
jgi:hypothetical protein